MPFLIEFPTQPNRENFRRNREVIRRNREFSFDISESLQARPRRSNGGASIVIPAEGFRPSNERSFTDRVFAPYRGLHPLERAALSRRTPRADIEATAGLAIISVEFYD